MQKKPRLSTRFHSWAENDFSASLDLNELMVQHPAATFFIRVKGDGMYDEGICSHDILVVDRSLPLASHRIIVARLEGQLVVRKVQITANAIFLLGYNGAEPLIITAERDFEVWGVVTYIIRQT